MPDKKQEIRVWRTSREDIFLCEGKTVTIPSGWIFVPSGDPGLTRRLKASGDYWVLVHKRKNRIEALGLFTLSAQVDRVKRILEMERSTPAYRNKLDAGRKRREEEQNQYVVTFRKAVMDFLAFAPRYQELAERFAAAVTDHAVPVGCRPDRVHLAAFGQGDRRVRHDSELVLLDAGRYEHC